MSILIESMEMPTSCLKGGCPIEGAFCTLWTEEHWKSPDEPYRKRHPKCPLIPVPPHGRLIDQDEYRDEFMNGVYELCSDDPDNYRANAIIDLFDDAPTVIEAEKG